MNSLSVALQEPTAVEKDRNAGTLSSLCLLLVLGGIQRCLPAPSWLPADIYCFVMSSDSTWGQ